MNIIQNIYNIIAVGALIILNLVAIAKGAATIVKSIQDAKSATEEEKQAAKEYWEKNGKAKEYIESGATAMLTAEVDAVKVADGIPADEVVKVVGAGVREAIETAMEAAKEADGAATVEVTAETEAEATVEIKEK